MRIQIVGNVIKDVYLNLDSRTEKLEIDKNGVGWLDFSFNASEHHFFSRASSFGGAAVSLEVLEKLGLEASINHSDLKITEEGMVLTSLPDAYRYIMISDGKVSYLAPSSFTKTPFSASPEAYDYLYIDRSAEISYETLKKIEAYLDISVNTRLVLYVRNLNNPNLNSLIPRASLIFYENSDYISKKISELTDENSENSQKIIYLSEKEVSFLNLSEKISVQRIDMSTHLSTYSIISATILGCFILGLSVEDSLKMARLNAENSRLDAVLSLKDLETLKENQVEGDSLELIAANLLLYPKGILAADESGGSIKKKFERLNIPDTYENRRDYRNIFFTTKDLEKYVNGVILFDETARQFADNGQTFVDYLISRRITPGIKVDEGLETFENSLETYTKGLKNLPPRLKEYYNLGLRFAKWRAAFEIRLGGNGEILTPTSHAIEENCRILAEYAKACQSTGLVPIVEPEVVYDGYYSIEQSASVTSNILDCLFKNLKDFGINLRACILKVNMILSGKQFEAESSPEEVGRETAKVLKEHIPSDLAGVVFLSGGQTVDQATNNLAKVEENGPFPWPVTFSFARALQDPALYAWSGDNKNKDTASEAFKSRLIANVEAVKRAKKL